MNINNGLANKVSENITLAFNASPQAYSHLSLSVFNGIAPTRQEWLDYADIDKLALLGTGLATAYGIANVGYAEQQQNSIRLRTSTWTRPVVSTTDTAAWVLLMKAEGSTSNADTYTSAIIGDVSIIGLVDTALEADKELILGDIVFTCPKELS